MMINIATMPFSDARHWCWASLRGNSEPITIRVHGLNLTLRPATPDLEVALETLSGEFQIISRTVPILCHDFIIDAGGYIGTAAIALAKRYPQARIISIEPDKENFTLLEHNTTNYPNIIPLHLALSDKSGKAALKDRGTGPWGRSILSTTQDKSSWPTIQQVDCVTVDQLMDRFGISGIDIFKLDVEGAERAIFNADNLSWIDKTTAIFVELHDRWAPGCTRAFTNATFERKNIQTSGEKILSLHKSVKSPLLSVTRAL